MRPELESAGWEDTIEGKATRQYSVQEEIRFVMRSMGVIRISYVLSMMGMLSDIVVIYTDTVFIYI